MRIKSFECPKSIRNYEKKDTLNVRRLVDKSFVPSSPANHRIILQIVGFKVGWGLKFMLDFSPQKFLIGLEKRILELLS